MADVARYRPEPPLDLAQVPTVRHIATFCGQCSCGCPELFVDDTAAPEQRIVITDDFGQRIQMSVGQLADLVADVRTGVLDKVLAAGGGTRTGSDRHPTGATSRFMSCHPGHMLEASTS